MTYSADITIQEAMRSLGAIAGSFIGTLNNAREAYLNLLEAKGIDTVAVWARRLHDLKSVTAQLSVIADEHKILGILGANTLTGFQAGRRVNLTGFTDASNLVTNELITEARPDYIILGNCTTLVDEDGHGDEAIVTLASEEEMSRTQAMVEAAIALNDLWECATGLVVSADDRMDILRRVS